MKSIPKRWFFAASLPSRSSELFTRLILVALIGILAYATGDELAFPPLLPDPDSHRLLVGWLAPWPSR